MGSSLVMTVAGRIREEREGAHGMSVEEEPIQTEAGSLTMVQEVRLLHERSRVPQNASRSLRVCEEVRRRRLPDPTQSRL